jgi:hypothetical protein
MKKFIGNLAVLLTVAFMLAFAADAPFLRGVKEQRLWGWWFVLLVPLVLFIVQVAVWVALPWSRPFGGRVNPGDARGSSA